ncbi:hypothetical protein [Serratia proteamaculans]|uniref:hypothetical protein n=1 Tax=Serratia proteamaculans TaxID=28151 RepID=UPI003CFEFA1E
MNQLIKTLLIVSLVATAAGCSTIEDINARGQALYNADPASYDAMPNSASEYFKQNPQFNTQGS